MILGLKAFYAFALLAMLVSAPAHARGGGGCLAAGTLISTPSGDRAIEDLKAGDIVLTQREEGGSKVSSPVIDTVEYTAQDWIEIEFRQGKIVSTPEHPFFIDNTTLMMASKLREGLSIGNSKILRITEHHHEPIQVYNLLTAPPNSYLANNAWVHNKGCFLPNTPVLLADGTSKNISEVRAGDHVRAFKMDGNMVDAEVHRVYQVQEDHYYTILTASGSTVRVTGEHPMYIGDGRFKLVKGLKTGDQVILFRGGLERDTIRSIERTSESVTVYNLQTDFPNTYIASSFAVHNKGGGGGGGHGGGGGGVYFRGSRYSSCGSIPDSVGRDECNASQTRSTFLTIGIAGLFAFLQWLFGRSSLGNLDKKVSKNAYRPIASQAEDLVRTLERSNSEWDLEKIKRIAQRAFLTLQDCWTNRNYGPMVPLVFDDLRVSHEAQIQGMFTSHEINVLNDVTVEDLRIIRVRWEERQKVMEFTALIEASATDYYIDDRTQIKVRGDDSKTVFQEYWTFQFYDGNWLLREITQIAERDITSFENLVELEKSPDANLQPTTVVSETKISRLIRDYAKADPAWNEKKMLQRGRATSIAYCLSLENGALTLLKDQLTARMQNSMTAGMEQAKQRGESRFYKNLCCRSAEVVHATDNGPSDYLIRATMHAQQLLRRGDEPVWEDVDVRPFVLFMKYVREGDQFLLDEVEEQLKNKV